MKTKNIILLFILAILLGHGLHAQVKIGFKGGYNIATTNFLFKYEATELPTISSIDLIQLIVPIEININQHYSIQPALHFKQSGNHMKTLGDNNPHTNIINYWGLGFMNKFRLETHNVTPYALAGVQTSIAADGHIKYNSPDAVSPFLHLVKEDISFENLGLKRFDVNFRVGVGLAMKVRKAELLFELTYDKGMIDMDKDPSVSAYNEKGIGIMIGIMKNWGREK